MNQTGATNNTKGTRSVRKVRSACVRCRNRRIKCDGEIPACRNCLKVNVACVDADGRLGDVLLPRSSFSADCIRRIQWLEHIIHTELPHVDLSAGPKLDGSTNAALQSAHAMPVSFTDSRAVSKEVSEANPPFVSSQEIAMPASSQSIDCAMNPSHSDSWESPPGDSNIADEVRAVAQSLGQISLHEDSRQTYYLGTSTGILFAHLIGASTSGLHSSSDARAREVSKAVDHASLEQLRIFLHHELPPRNRCQSLLDEYFRTIHPDFPILDPESLCRVCEVVYEFSSKPLSPKLGRKGWPEDLRAFAYNGEMEIRDGQYETSISVAPKGIGRFPQRLFKAAMSLAGNCLAVPCLTTIQSMVLLLAHSLMTPSDINIWTMVHLCMASCVDIGLHREMTATPHNRLPIHIRRMVFWTVYSLDRSISTIQGRPLGIRDETFDLQRPGSESVLQGDGMARWGSCAPSFDPSGIWPYTAHRFAIDRWISAIKLLLYRCPSACEQNLFIWPSDLENQQSILKGRLDTWRQEITSVVSQLNVPDEFLRNRLRLKLEAQYYSAIMLLFQPSQALRKPNPEACRLCYRSAVARLSIYAELYEIEQLFCSWRSMQDIFHAGVTLIYLVCGLPSVQQSVSLPSVSKNMRLCSSLLSTGGEWWPSVKKVKRRFERAADLLIEKLSRLNNSLLSSQHAQDMINFDTTRSSEQDPEPISPRFALSLNCSSGGNFPVATNDGFLPNWNQPTSHPMTFPVVSPAKFDGTDDAASGRESADGPSVQEHSDSVDWRFPIFNGEEPVDDTLWQFVQSY
ncbi:unnamed protein product [Penicillium salamii]|nr:unnamed protein product [Penicillium salamii]